jgi:cell wall-associated NlpC family hydrolase
MRPMMNPRAARACAALGALSATTLAVSAHAAQAAQSPLLVSYIAPLHRYPGPRLIAGRSPLSAIGSPRKRATGHRTDITAAPITAMVAAGDRIARLPYLYGGGHGSFTAGGYDCSGSVSYVLHAAGLISIPLDSSGLESFGDPGPGRHVSVYANAGHAWMTIDGRRYDTIAFQETGTRWSSTISSDAGYVVRHPRGM